jgi:hypothetical protein
MSLRGKALASSYQVRMRRGAEIVNAPRSLFGSICYLVNVTRCVTN